MTGSYRPCPLYFFLYSLDCLLTDVFVLACTPGRDTDAFSNLIVSLTRAMRQI
jgi:hypothetical protein